jgi:hypothetical protein
MPHLATHPRVRLPIAALALACAASLHAQTHKVAKPETVVRAVGVYEWTGDMAKPAASRLIPVTLFIDNKFEDAGVYLARPVPMALLTGNVYEVDQSGVPKGTLDLAFSRHFVPTETATTVPFDDGWFGYGKFIPPAPPKKSTLKPSKTLPVINAMDDDDKPHFSSKSATPGSGGAAANVPPTSASTTAPPDDPDRPTLHRGASSSSGQTASADTTAPAADPDRPTMKRHPDTSDSSDTSASSDSGSSTSPANDPDRPTLRRRSPEEAKKAAKEANQGSVTAVGSLNDDPNRPTLHRGKPAGAPSEEDFPKLSGLPGDQDLHQLVAVSDAANRPVHDFSLAFDSDSDRQAILSKMEDAARAQLTAYEIANSEKSAPPKPPTPAPRTPNSKLRRNTQPDTPPPPPEPLLDEQLKAFTLSYGGAPTYVYTAHTAGLGAGQRFVTLVAQVDMQGTPEIAFKSVTDAVHLDRTPRYRFVDVVDADASNRASLLFELREQNARQFALYRVIGARADQTFLTGTTQ